MCLSKEIYFSPRAAGENDDRLLPPFLLPEDGDREERSNESERGDYRGADEKREMLSEEEVHWMTASEERRDH